MITRRNALVDMQKQQHMASIERRTRANPKVQDVSLDASEENRL